MSEEVLYFLPSEIARLVLGYLLDEGYANSYKIFMKECPHLQEYLMLKRRGQNYPLHINGMTLCQMLEEYAHFKLTDTQRRQSLGNAALWLQLDAVLKTLKDQTASKQCRGADGMTQSARVRRMHVESRRKKELERRRKKIELCSKSSKLISNKSDTEGIEDDYSGNVGQFELTKDSSYDGTGQSEPTKDNHDDKSAQSELQKADCSDDIGQSEVSDVEELNTSSHLPSPLLSPAGSSVQPLVSSDTTMIGKDVSVSQQSDVRSGRVNTHTSTPLTEITASTKSNIIASDVQSCFRNEQVTVDNTDVCHTQPSQANNFTSESNSSFTQLCSKSPSSKITLKKQDSPTCRQISGLESEIDFPQSMGFSQNVDSNSQEPSDQDQASPPNVQCNDNGENIKSPVKHNSELSFQGADKNPRRKRPPKRKSHGKQGEKRSIGSANENSNCTEEGSLMADSSIPSFLEQILNNTLFQEKLAENINKTLQYNNKLDKSLEKRKPSSSKPAADAIKPNVKVDGTKVESREVDVKSPDFRGSMRAAVEPVSDTKLQTSQSLNTDLDDILNLHETQMSDGMIGGIIEMTKEDPNFESLFNLFSVTENTQNTQKTDFSGIRLEMGKDATVDNQTFPSFTESFECPRPSHTSSEEKLMLDILQGASANNSHVKSFQQMSIDEPIKSHNSSLQEMSTDEPIKSFNSSFQQMSTNEPIKSQESDNSKHGIHINSFQQQSDDHRCTLETDSVKHPRSENDGDCMHSHVKNCNDLCPSPSHESADHCQTEVSDTSLRSVDSPDGDVFVSSTLITRVQSSLKSLISSKLGKSTPSSKTEKIKEIRDRQFIPSETSGNSLDPVNGKNVSTDLSVRSTETENHSSLLRNSEKEKAKSPCTVGEHCNLDKLPSDSLKNQSICSSPNDVNKKQPNAKSYPKFAQEKENSSQCTLNCDETKYNSSESKSSHASDEQVVSSTTTLSTSPNILSKSLKTVSPQSPTLSFKSGKKSEKSIPKNTKTTSTHVKQSRRRANNKSHDNDMALGERPSSELIETFQTSVSSDHGFPVLSIKSVMKSPNGETFENTAKDQIVSISNGNSTNAHSQVSYKSFIDGVNTVKNSSTPVTLRALTSETTPVTERMVNSETTPECPHSTTPTEVFSEMLDFVSTLERNLYGETTVKKEDVQNQSESVKKKKGRKKKDRSSSNAILKPEWSKDLTALIGIVSPQKKKGSNNKKRNSKKKEGKAKETSMKNENTRSTLQNLSLTKVTQKRHDSGFTKQFTNTDGHVSTAQISKYNSADVDNNDKNSENNIPTDSCLDLSIKKPTVHESKENGKNVDTFIDKGQNSDRSALTFANKDQKNQNNHNAARNIRKDSSECLIQKEMTSEEDQGTPKYLSMPNLHYSDEGLITPRTACSAASALRDNSVSNLDVLNPTQNLTKDYSHILYSPNHDFLDFTDGDKDTESEITHLPHLNQLSTPPLHVPVNSASQNSHLQQQTIQQTQQSSGVVQVQSVAPTGIVLETRSLSNEIYLGTNMKVSCGTQPVKINDVYQSDEHVSAFTQVTGQNIGNVYIQQQDEKFHPPSLVTNYEVHANSNQINASDTFCAVSSSFQTINESSLSQSRTSTPNDKITQLNKPLMVFPVGRFIPEQKLHVRSLDFGPEATNCVIRQTGYGRGRKKKDPYADDSEDKPGSASKKHQEMSRACTLETKDNTKSKKRRSVRQNSDVKSKNKLTTSTSKNKIESTITDYGDNTCNNKDFIPDASGSVYTAGGYVKKIPVLKKTPCKRNSSETRLADSFEPLPPVVIVSQDQIYNKSGNMTVPAGMDIPTVANMNQDDKGADKNDDSDESIIDVEGDVDLPILRRSPEKILTSGGKFSTQLVTSRKSLAHSSENNRDHSFSRKSLNYDLNVQPSSVESSVSSKHSVVQNHDSCSRMNPASVETNNSRPDSVSTVHSRFSMSHMNDSNELPDIEVSSSPFNYGPMISMSTPPKKRITASLKSSSGCYFFSSSSQESKSQQKLPQLEKRECDTTITDITESPKTPKGKGIPKKAIRRSPRILGSPSRLTRSQTTPLKMANSPKLSESSAVGSPLGKARLKRCRDESPSEVKIERKRKKARQGKKVVDLSKVDMDKFLNKVHNSQLS